MVVVESYIREDEEFIAIGEYKGPIKDPDYVDGAVVLSVDGNYVFIREAWDDINHFWPYLISATLDVLHGRTGSFFYPDQPIPVTLTPIASGTRVLVSVKDVNPRLANVDTCELCTAIAAGARYFFNHFLRLVPDRDSYEDTMDDLDKIESLLRKRAGAGD